MKTFYNTRVLTFAGIFIALLLVAPAYAQQQTVSGVITSSEDGELLPGVNILERGTVNGTVTDVNGKFQLNAGGNAVLIVSMIGFVTEEIEVANRSVIDISLTPDITRLQEIVVIGYGESSKKSISSSIVSVDGEDLTRMVTGNVSETLQGRVAGVQVISGGGAPGAAPRVLIRGVVTGRGGGTDPLIVVDGIPLPTGSNLNFLNPNDIKDMQILKDASASSIYGSRGSNGVILITTKRGSAGQTGTIQFDGSYGLMNFQEIPSANATEYANVVNQRRINDGDIPLYENPGEFGEGTNWWNEVIRDYAPIQNYNLSINGGKEDLLFAGSLSLFDQESNYYDQGWWKRITGRFNIDYHINDKLKFQQDLSPRYEHWETTPNQLWNMLRIDPITDVFIPTDERVGRNEFSIYARSRNAVPNPVAAVARQFDETRFFGLFSNTAFEYKPINGLTLRTQFGINFTSQRRDVFRPEFDIDPNEQRLVNDVRRRFDSRFDWVWNNTVTYQKVIGDHSITAMAGVVAEEFRNNLVQAHREDVPGLKPELRYVDAATGTILDRHPFFTEQGVRGTETVRTLFSYLGRVMYDFKGRYFLTAAVRRDASSTFPENNRWGTFPSVSAAWDIAAEDFFSPAFVGSLKLKAGYGQIGNQNVPADGRFFAVDDRFYVFGGERVVTNFLAQFGNEELKWETVEDINIGLEGELWDSRLGFSVERYVKNSRDLLFPVELPNYTGVPGLVWQNIGSFESKGWDIALNYGDNIRDFTYNVGVTVTTNESIVDEIAPGNDQILLTKREDLGNRFLKIMEVGSVTGAFYGFKTDGIFRSQTEINSHTTNDGTLIQPNAQPGDIRFVDQNGDGQINDEGDLTILGNPFPDFTAGVNIDLGYKNWDLSMQWYGNFGNEVINYTRIFRLSGVQDVNVAEGLFSDAWSETNPDSDIPRLTNLDQNGNFQVPSDFLIEDGTFVRLKNIQVGYTLPLKSIQRLRFYISAQNLLTFTEYTGFDPEVIQGGDIISGYGIDFGSYPLSRTLLLGLNVTF